MQHQLSSIWLKSVVYRLFFVFGHAINVIEIVSYCLTKVQLQYRVFKENWWWWGGHETWHQHKNENKKFSRTCWTFYSYGCLRQLDSFGRFSVCPFVRLFIYSFTISISCNVLHVEQCYSRLSLKFYRIIINFYNETGCLLGGIFVLKVFVTCVFILCFFFFLFIIIQNKGIIKIIA